MVAPRTAPDRTSRAETEGIAVRVSPRYLPEHSNPSDGQWVFAYAVRIENLGQSPAQLIARRWVIRDADGEEQIVEGDGVIGQQPRLDPGRAHEYESFCPLPTSWGTMEGHYVMRRDDGSQFNAIVARFILVADDA